MGKEWVYYAHLEVHYADALEKGGECSKTPPLLEHASKIFEKESPSYVSHVHWVRARCLIAGHRIDAAIGELEKADALCRTGDCEVAADVRWTLGRLLLEENRDRSRGATLVDEARSRWASMGLTSRVAEIDAWRSKR
jgi:hypothetical protein